MPAGIPPVSFTGRRADPPGAEVVAVIWRAHVMQTFSKFVVRPAPPNPQRRGVKAGVGALLVATPRQLDSGGEMDP
jgi:hypothetical protein